MFLRGASVGYPIVGHLMLVAVDVMQECYILGRNNTTIDLNRKQLKLAKMLWAAKVYIDC